MDHLEDKRSGINPNFSVKHRSVQDIQYYLDGLAAGNRYILSECITLLESTVSEKRALALRILEAIPNQAPSSIRVGITGSPGVGKSTFIETFGMYLIRQGHKVATLAIDPSSQINRGSILGDKTRMQILSLDPNAYIRPSASGTVLGGTAAFTKEAIRFCESAGFDFIIVETVGVGQSETEVDNITDVNLLLLLPGAGDDIQGIKRGIVENADIFIITKADGKQLELAKQTSRSYSSALQLFHHDLQDWHSPVILTSAIENIGIDLVYDAIGDYQKRSKSTGMFLHKRLSQEMRWFEMQTLEAIKKLMLTNSTVKEIYSKLSKEVQQQQISTSSAIQQMESTLKSIIQSNHKK